MMNIKIFLIFCLFLIGCTSDKKEESINVNSKISETKIDFKVTKIFTNPIKDYLLFKEKRIYKKKTSKVITSIVKSSNTSSVRSDVTYGIDDKIWQMAQSYEKQGKKTLAYREYKRLWSKVRISSKYSDNDREMLLEKLIQLSYDTGNYQEGAKWESILYQQGR